MNLGKTGHLEGSALPVLSPVKRGVGGQAWMASYVWIGGGGIKSKGGEKRTWANRVTKFSKRLEKEWKQTRLCRLHVSGSGLFGGEGVYLGRDHLGAGKGRIKASEK